MYVFVAGFKNLMIFWLTNKWNEVDIWQSTNTSPRLAGSFGVTKKAMAGRLGVGDRPFLCPNS